LQLLSANNTTTSTTTTTTHNTTSTSTIPAIYQRFALIYKSSYLFEEYSPRHVAKPPGLHPAEGGTEEGDGQRQAEQGPSFLLQLVCFCDHSYITDFVFVVKVLKS
jgi:hypothetical protein